MKKSEGKKKVAGLLIDLTQNLQVTEIFTNTVNTLLKDRVTFCQVCLKTTLAY